MPPPPPIPALQASLHKNDPRHTLCQNVFLSRWPFSKIMHSRILWAHCVPEQEDFALAFLQLQQCNEDENQAPLRLQIQHVLPLINSSK